MEGQDIHLYLSNEDKEKKKKQQKHMVLIAGSFL